MVITISRVLSSPVADVLSAFLIYSVAIVVFFL
jgi:hypothetical protein